MARFKRQTIGQEGKSTVDIVINGYINLVIAIVKQAKKDWEEQCNNGHKEEILSFVKSDWFEFLITSITDFDLEKIRRAFINIKKRS